MPSLRKAAALSSGRHQPSAESYQATVADDLAGTTVTAESLLAELAAARQSRGGQPRSRPADSEKPRRSGSFLGRTFACACVAMILLTLVCMSPLRDYVPSPLRDHVDRITHFALASLKAR